MKPAPVRLLVVAVLIIGMVLLGLALPSIVERRINAQMADMGDYTGHVEDVGVSIWRGNYTLHKLLIQKTEGKVPVPLLDAPTVDISLSWRNLFRGAIVADVRFNDSIVHFVDGKNEDDNQSGLGVDWRDRLETLVPTHLNDVQLRNGTIYFHNFVSDPPVDLKATQVDADISNLTNVRDADGRRVAELNATGILFESAKMESGASFDPFDERIKDFKLAFRVLEIDLTRINNLAQAYTSLDFESGNGELVMELEAVDGNLTGYIKPLFQQLRIFSWKKDVEQSDKNPFEIAWEVIAEGITTVLTNQPAEQFGTRIEVTGDINDPNTSTFSAVVGILRNAFVSALHPYFDGVHLRPRGD